ncbi:uncharacterized protein LOC107274005 [Cephus cinctus]|uniref:Uncharacterized protein LOC107274005 n=1 Tax=Cephus cinctus TaxID=211228 RepID=A0AAJ7CDP6_CEPCN|nr:uncharacterized protein LOC107274005 [Cephus cinctus]XP_024947062.1 uncharacterized protein LOC107274005 [Cephus cinctus]
MLLHSLLLIFWATATLATPPPGYVKKPDNDKDPPAYSYRYEIGETDGKGHGKSETRSGELAKGRYYVNSDRSSTDVKYFADEWGYHPLVHYGLSNEHSATSASFALGEPAVTALKNGGDVGPHVELPKMTQRRPLQIIQPYTIEQGVSPTKNYDPGQDLVPEVSPVSQSNDATSSGQPTDENKSDPNESQPILLIPNFTTSRPIYRVTTIAPLPEVTGTNSNLLEDLLLVQNDGNFGQRLPSGATKNFDYQTTTRASTTGSFKLTKQNGDVTYRIHEDENPNRAFLTSVKKNHKQDRLKQYLYSQQLFAPTGRVNISDSILQGLHVFSTTVAPPVSTTATQLSTGGEVNYEYSNTIEHERQSYAGLSSYTTSSSKNSYENAQRNPEIINYELDVNLGTKEKLTTPGLSAYTTKAPPSYKVESSTTVNANRGTFSKPIVVAEIAQYKPEYSTTFTCDDEVSSTPNPGFSTTLGPETLGESILVTPKPRGPGHITTSSVILNPIQAGVALVNAGETHLIGGDTSGGTPAPVKEEIADDTEDASNYDRQEVVQNQDKSRVFYEKINPAFGQERNLVKDILDQEVEVQKSVEIYHNAPMHEIHYPAELIRTDQSYQLQNVNQHSNDNSAATSFDIRNNIYNSEQNTGEKLGSGNILGTVESGSVGQSESLEVRNDGSYQHATLQGLINQPADNQGKYQSQVYVGNNEHSQQVIEEDSNQQVYQSQSLISNTQENTEQQSINLASNSQAYQPQTYVENNQNLEQNINEAANVQVYQPQIYVENNQNAQEQIINEANNGQTYQSQVYVENNQNGHEIVNEVNNAQNSQQQIYFPNNQNVQQQPTNEASNSQVYESQNNVNGNQNALQQAINEGQVYQPQIYIGHNQNPPQQVNIPTNQQVYQSQITQQNGQENAQSQSDVNFGNIQSYKLNQNGATYTSELNHGHQQLAVTLPYTLEASKEITIPGLSREQSVEDTQQDLGKFLDYSLQIPLSKPIDGRTPESGSYVIQVEKQVPYPITQLIEKKVEIPQPHPVQVIQTYPVEVEKVVEKKIQVSQPYPVHVQVPVEKIIEKKIPQTFVVEKIIQKPVPQPYPVEKIVEKTVHVPQPYPVEVEKIVEKKVPVPQPYLVHIQVPVDRIVEKHVAVPQPYPVHIEKIVEKKIPYPVEKLVPQPYPVHINIPQPYPVEKIIEKKVPYPVEIEKFIERKVPYPVPIHVPYGIQYGVSYQQIMKPQLPNLHSIYQRTQTPLYGLPIKNQESSSDSTSQFQGYQYNKPSISFIEGSSNHNNIKHNHVYYSSNTVAPSHDKKHQLAYQSYVNHPYSGAHRRHAMRMSTVEKGIKDQYIGPVPPESPTNIRHSKNSLGIQSKSLQFSTTMTRAPSIVTTRRLRSEAHPQSATGTFRQSKMEYGFKPPMVPSVQYDEKTARKVES